MPFKGLSAKAMKRSIGGVAREIDLLGPDFSDRDRNLLNFQCKKR